MGFKRPEVQIFSPRPRKSTAEAVLSSLSGVRSYRIALRSHEGKSLPVKKKMKKRAITTSRKALVVHYRSSKLNSLYTERSEVSITQPHENVNKTARPQSGARSAAKSSTALSGQPQPDYAYYALSSFCQPFARGVANAPTLRGAQTKRRGQIRAAVIVFNWTTVSCRTLCPRARRYTD